MPTDPIVWRADPETVSRSVTARFMHEHAIATYDELVRRSQADPTWFWGSVVDFLGIPFQAPYRTVLDLSRGKPWAEWFVEGRINLSEACVDRWAASMGDVPAVVAEREGGGEPSVLTFSELLQQVEALAGALDELGVRRGDTVGVLLPMSEHAVIALLGVARIGAVFVPIFSGYGTDAIRTRIRDSRARVIITADGFTRRGRLVRLKESVDEAMEPGSEARVLVVDYAHRQDTPLNPGRDVWWHEALESSSPRAAAPTDAEDPVLLAFTSGTTGRPKGAVHVHGGLTVKLAQEGAFQLDLQRGDLHMWVTDMGWIMGPWMVVAALANGASIATYDGAPDFPDPSRIWRLVEKLGITALGVSPTLIRSLQSAGEGYTADRDLSSLRVLGSTGEPWNPSPWWWLFEEVGRARIPIVNLSGGTEVGACFLSVNLLQGVKPCSLGGPALGMSVDVYDPQGKPLRGEVGELVCTEPWPGMTRGFWDDPDRYLEAYWNRFHDVWVHGDWASIDEDGFWYLHGRSDDTLNIAGKRIGPAEIESVAVGHPNVVMAAAIGIPDPVKGEQVVLYAVPKTAAGSELAEEVAQRVAEQLGKPFRPQAVILVADLPRTRSAKIMRRLIKARVLGEDLGDLAGLENPEAVEAIPVL